GQWAPSPYVALWSRLAGFTREDLTVSIDKGLVIKATLMRATLHLVSAKEYAAYALATLDGRFAAWRPPGGPDLATLKDIHDRVFKFAATPRTRDEIREFISRDAPQDERLRNWYLFAAVTASGIIWEKGGARWEHRQLARFVAPPAKLRKAPKPDAAILGHDAAERTRILPAEYKKQVIFSAEVWTTFLVDGFVAGRWKIGATPRQAVLELLPFKRLAKGDRAALVDEGERLVRFYYP